MKKKGSSRRKKDILAFLSGNTLLVKFLGFFLLFIILLGGVFFSTYHFFTNSSFFSINKITATKDVEYAFPECEKFLRSRYIGRNLFSVDLKEIQGLIRNKFPELKNIEVKRQPPDVIDVDVISREAIAVIDKSIVIDDEGVALSAAGSLKSLVNIRGVKSFTRPIKGVKISNKVLDRSLALIGVLRRHLSSEKVSLTYIDAMDENNILVGIDNVEIKMGAGDISKKIERLKEILHDPKVNLKDIKYIDLRFEDIVIAPR